MDRKETDEDTESIDSKPRKSIMKFSDEPESIQEEELEARGFRNECALEKASCFQRLLFTWVFPIWRIAKETDKITIPMLGKLREGDKSEVQIRKLEKYWNIYKSKTVKNKLCKAFLRAYACNLFIATLTITAHCLMEMVSPLFLYRVMKFLQNPEDRDFLKASILALSMVTAQYVSFIIAEHGWVYSDIQGYKAEMAFIGLITEKSMKTSPSASKNFTQGEIINRLGTDTSKVQQFQQRVARLLSILITLFIGIFGLSNLLGLALIAGLVPLAFLLLVNLIFAKKLANLQKNMMKVQDKRMEVTTEAMQNIKTLKMSIWVPHFKERINKARDQGIKLLQKKNLIEIGQYGVFNLIPLSIIGTIMLVFVATGHTLTPSIVFTLILIFDIMRFQLFDLPYIIESFVETYTSIKRIEDYLLAEEAESYFTYSRSEDPFHYALQIQNACFSWGTSPSDEEKNFEE